MIIRILLLALVVTCLVNMDNTMAASQREEYPLENYHDWGWGRFTDSLWVYEKLRDAVPENYTFGPARNLTPDEEDAQVWCVSFNYNTLISGIQDPTRHSAILDIWRITQDDRAPALLRQFTLSGDWVPTISQIDLVSDTDRRLLYVVSEDSNLNGDISCFELGYDNKVRLISEERYGWLLWPIRLGPDGPLFVSFRVASLGETDGDWRANPISLYSLTKDGIWISGRLDVGDLLSREEFDSVEAASDFEELVSVKMKTTYDWLACITEQNEIENAFTSQLEDGTEYLHWSPVGKWHASKY